jgi:hypothetical protein
MVNYDRNNFIIQATGAALFNPAVKLPIYTTNVEPSMFCFRFQTLFSAHPPDEAETKAAAAETATPTSAATASGKCSISGCRNSTAPASTTAAAHAADNNPATAAAFNTARDKVSML